MGYLKGLLEKANEKIKGMGRKRIIENCAVIVVLGIILILVAGQLFGGRKNNPAQKPSPEETGRINAEVMQEPGDQLEKRMEDILSEIKGAGKVQVMITYSSGTEIITAKDIDERTSKTEEADSEGGKRSMSQREYRESTIYEDSSAGEKQPVVLKEIYPEVKGVVVVAEGAGNTLVKEQLIRAVTALLDVPVYKVQVFEMK